MKSIREYKKIVDQMNQQGLLDTNAIDPSWIDTVLELGEVMNDQDTFANNIELAIQKSIPTWIFAHHYDDNEKRYNTEFLRNNITIFLVGIPEEFSGIPRELDRLAKLKDANGNYVIGDEFVNRAYKDAESIIRCMIAYLEKFAVGVPEHEITIPFKNRLITYKSGTPNHPTLGTHDVRFWRMLFPKRS